MRMRNIVAVAFVLSGALLLARSANAQDVQAVPTHPDRTHKQAVPVHPDRTHKGSVVGNVADASGNPVVGATVVLQDSVTQESSATTSGEKGEYKFVKLLPGEYTVQAEEHGLRSHSKHVKVSNGAAFRQDLVISAAN